MRIHSWGLPAICFLLSHVVFAQQPVPTGTSNLSSTEAAELQALSDLQLDKLGSHRRLAKYMALRRNSLTGGLPDPGSEIVHYARKSLGVKYKRDAKAQSLLAADCVTWTERVISLALSDTWQDAYRLQRRLRYAGGDDTDFANVNHYPVADWLVSNDWLFEDVTDRIGGTLASLNVVTDRQAKYEEIVSSANPGASEAGVQGATIPVVVDGLGTAMTTSYITADSIDSVLPAIQTGDIVFFIGDFVDRSEGVRRPRCFHIGVLEHNGDNVNLLHCVRPRSHEVPLSHYAKYRVAQDRFLGIKVARVRQGARQIVRDELALSTIEALAPLDQDLKLGVIGVGNDGTMFVPPAREPDVEIQLGGIVYGGIDLRARDSLYRLFRDRWSYVYELPVNARFRAANPDPARLRCFGCNPQDVRSSRIFVPLRNVGEPSESVLLPPIVPASPPPGLQPGPLAGPAASATSAASAIVMPTRDPDVLITQNSIDYGGIDIIGGDTLYGLFGVAWQDVYELDINADFRAANPDPNDLTAAVASSTIENKRIFFKTDGSQP